MPTATQRRRLIEGIAFIESHRDLWEQGCWVNMDAQISGEKCGTVGCLAGHIAITLNPSKPVVNIDKAIFKKKTEDLTEKEHDLIQAMYQNSEYVRATPADEYTESRYVNGRWIKSVHVRHRAARLIGLGWRDAEDGLFSGTNDIDDIYHIASEDFDISVEELKKQVDQVAIDKGWKKKSRGRTGVR